MIQIGRAPFLECSTRGDKRFSAFNARPRSLAGRSIEEAYQAMKVLPDGRTGLDWRAAKGRTAVNYDACVAAYKGWWREWIEQEDLLPVLIAASGLSDLFGQRGRVCQALVLWDLRSQSTLF